jgi:hypothetical protein
MNDDSRVAVGTVTHPSSTVADPKNPEELHFFDASEDHDSDEELQDAIATSGALVGENVLDSPDSAYRRAIVSPMYSCPSAPELDNPNSFSVGIMAKGLAWVQTQRDRRRRRYLQNQAEQQLRKLHEVQEEEKTNVRSLMDNSTFRNLANQKSTDTEIEENDPYKNTSKVDQEKRNAIISPSGDGYTGALELSPERFEDDMLFVPKVRVEEEPDEQDCPFILTPHEMQQLAVRVLPRGIAYARWTRIYSLTRDGDSFDACLRKIQHHARTLMVLRTSRNALLGGFADAKWEAPSFGSARYYGGPEACLFHWLGSASASQSQKPILRCYKWTGVNRYIQLCDVSRRMLAFGGGGVEGAFGLSVEQDFQYGSTGPCATFDNAPLCEDAENFAIIDMEIFGFLTGQF